MCLLNKHDSQKVDICTMQEHIRRAKNGSVVDTTRYRNQPVKLQLLNYDAIQYKIRTENLSSCMLCTVIYINRLLLLKCCCNLKRRGLPLARKEVQAAQSSSHEIIKRSSGISSFSVAGSQMVSMGWICTNFVSSKYA